MRVGLPPPAPSSKRYKRLSSDKELLAYVIGIALGDGNLSNPNGRAQRLRITCDPKYPNLITRIQRAIQSLLPENKVSLVQRKDGCIDVSCFSNHWERILGWRVGRGSKITQHVRVPEWIRNSREFSKKCLTGLIETDGSIYIDRGYPMVMFSTAVPELARDFAEMVAALGFQPRRYRVPNPTSFGGPHTIIYRVRVAKSARQFLEIVGPEKS